jgi:DNA (cytosine-5)-methyltransferase 1
MTDLTAVSLFAGVGGFDLAMERNGINVVATVEIDKNARGVLQHQFPNTQHFTDVTTVTGEDLRNAGFIPERGIIAGGFPCQDLSVAGKRAGLVGARSGLFYEIARIADETKAKWLVLENVPGLLSSRRGADMGTVIGTLVELGYGVAWRVLDAQHFGVPQRRRRVFIVAERAGNPARCAKVLFECTSVRGDTSQGRTPREEVAGDVGASPEIAGSLTANGFRRDLNKAQSGHLTVERVVNRMTAFGQYAEDDGTSSSLKARDYKDATDLVIELTLDEPHHGDGRATEGIANTLTARMGTGGNNTPILVEPQTFVKVIRSGARDAEGNLPPEVWREEQTNPTLNQFDQGDSRTVVAIVETTVQTYPIDDGREIEKHQNGSGIGNDGDPAYTLDRSQHSSVATIAFVHPINTMTFGGRPDLVNDARMGTGGNNVPVRLDLPVPVRMREGKPGGGKGPLMSEDRSLTLNTLNDQALFVGQAIRRLTPTECERLQGFPDGWTSQRIDEKKGLIEQVDSSRYKQMGNAVAVPCVEWIMARLVEQDNGR